MAARRRWRRSRTAVAVPGKSKPDRMFTATAEFYDAVYAALGKDYDAETDAIVRLVREAIPNATTLLDVGCGTGTHLERFARHGFAARGIDKDHKMVALARARCPELEIDPGDMLDFALPERFEAVVCLFGAIAYVRTPERLQQAIETMASHLAQPGVLVVEPFHSKQTWNLRTLHGVFVDKPDLKLARMSQSRQVGNLAILDFHYLVSTLRGGVERHFERHELGLFDESDYREAFEAARLTFESRDEPAFRRGLYLGKRGT